MFMPLSNADPNPFIRPTGQQRGPIVYQRTSILSRAGNATAYRPDKSKAGGRVKFQRSGTTYRVAHGGNLVRC